ncbi:uncharacterized protein LOC126393013 [Epinephelus moara]|uniref:uncharacterized protein LOC126393013 n=1 Tax=Epinephelus moara TaxID=300413 RepID=UPI00214F5536|nr:uncharacterized protein LOC126393013 [Epinephelus moara]
MRDLCIVKKNDSRAALKTKVETLHGALGRLRGKNITDACDADLKYEIFKVNLKLTEANDKLKKTADNLGAANQIIRDLKHQLQAYNLKQVRTAKANEDLRRQVEKAHEQLKEPVSQVNTEAPEDKECIPSTAEPHAPAAVSTVSVESLCGNTTPSNEREYPQEVDLHIPEPSIRRRRRNWFVRAFKGKRADKKLSQVNTKAPDDKECVPSTAEPDTLAAVSAVTVESLCGDMTPSDALEHPQQKDLHVPEPSARRTRRRNWFVRMFVCGRAEE